MPHPPEVSPAITSLDSLSDEELKALAKRFIERSDLAHAERRTQFPLTPEAIEQYLEEPRSGIKTNDRFVLRILAEELFRRYIIKLKATQPPDPPLGTPQIQGAPEA